MNVNWNDKQIWAALYAWPRTLPLPSRDELRDIVIAINGVAEGEPK